MVGDTGVESFLESQPVSERSLSPFEDSVTMVVESDAHLDEAREDEGWYRKVLEAEVIQDLGEVYGWDELVDAGDRGSMEDVERLRDYDVVVRQAVGDEDDWKPEDFETSQDFQVGEKLEWEHELSGETYRVALSHEPEDFGMNPQERYAREPESLEDYDLVITGHSHFDFVRWERARDTLVDTVGALKGKTSVPEPASYRGVQLVSLGPAFHVAYFSFEELVEGYEEEGTVREVEPVGVYLFDRYEDESGLGNINWSVSWERKPVNGRFLNRAKEEELLREGVAD